MAKRKAITKAPLVKKSNSNLKIIVASIFVACALVGGYLYSTMQKSSINEISSGINEGMPQPMPSTAPLVCATVSTFALSGSCETNNYQTVSFTCGTNKTVIKLGDKGSCKSVSTWYNEALSACANKCPSPKPTATPSNCYYTQPKCIKAPCPKILVCPTPTPTPVACSPMIGSCYNKAGACVRYLTTCERSTMCTSPFTRCGVIPSSSPKESMRPSTPTPSPAVVTTAIPVSSSTPTPYPTQQ